MSKSDNKKWLIGAGLLTGTYAVLDIIGKKNKAKNAMGIDDGNPYLDDSSATNQSADDIEDPADSDAILEPEPVIPDNFYVAHGKRVIDKALSFAGLVVLAPVYGAVSLAIIIDDPGPVLFTQKRVGQDKHFFKLHKFRSMKMRTPHDVPTHQLSNPDQYITRVGKILRKTSLDELPQIWDIFIGNMSIIGPRPALWNQEDLVAERDKYKANDLTPGLTGWAQINGRDELEIPQKAKLDGEYVSAEETSSLKALAMDAHCFGGTIKSVFQADGVVEGGTGEINKHTVLRDGVPITPEDAGFEDYGFRKHFDIDLSTNNHKRVLITGAGSYIGESFKTYAEAHYGDDFEIDILDMLNPEWQATDFSYYDVIFHVAGIAHADVGNVSEAVKAKYYAINTDLAIEVAKRAKTEGVSQFILMSSMIIYGESAGYGQERMITAETLPNPANFYGDSKWQADKGVRALSGDDFHVAVLRPPMIYGKGSKGNYPKLAKLAKMLPVFPDVDNQRSMLYIGNLCEFLCKLMLSGESGIYFPQNEEYTKTAEMVKVISQVVGKSMWTTKLFNPAVAIASYVPGKIGGLVDKAFGSMCYEQEIGRYNGIDYNINNLQKSIKKTEDSLDGKVDSFGSKGTDLNQKNILIISQYFYPEQFRINDMAQEWVKRGYKVTVLTGIPNYPSGKFFEGYNYTHHRKEVWKGIDIIRIPLIPRGNNSLGMVANYGSFVLSGFFWDFTTNIKADYVFIYEVSPMTQALVGVWYAKKLKIPCNLYVTDLWPDNVEIVTGIHNKQFLGAINTMVNYIYKNCNNIFTSSKSFVEKLVERGVNKEKITYWPQYAEDFYKPYKISFEEDIESKTGIPQDGIFNIIFAGNIGYAQGLNILIETVDLLEKQQLKVRFNIIGDGRYKKEMQKEITNREITSYFNFIDRQAAENIPKYMAASDAALICLSKSEVFAMTIPAKTQSCLACGIPVLVSADGEVRKIIENANCGLTSASEDAIALAENIKKMSKFSKEQLNELKNNALAYSKKNFSKNVLLNQMDEYFCC